MDGSKCSAAFVICLSSKQPLDDDSGHLHLMVPFSGDTKEASNMNLGCTYLIRMTVLASKCHLYHVDSIV